MKYHRGRGYVVLSREKNPREFHAVRAVFAFILGIVFLIATTVAAFEQEIHVGKHSRSRHITPESNPSEFYVLLVGGFGIGIGALVLGVLDVRRLRRKNSGVELGELSTLAVPVEEAHKDSPPL